MCMISNKNPLSEIPTMKPQDEKALQRNNFLSCGASTDLDW